MAAAKLKLIIEQGATFRKTLTWKAGTPAVPVDLTGCTGRMQIRRDVSSPTVLAELSTANGRVVMGGAAGTVELIIPAGLTEMFTWQDGVYDLEIVFASGDVRRLLYGPVEVSPEVTR